MSHLETPELRAYNAGYDNGMHDGKSLYKPLLKELLKIATEAPEINRGNYTDDEVMGLNDAIYEIYVLLKAEDL